MHKITLALALGFPAPLLAQDVLSVPEGCTAEVTVQQKDCTVSHHFTCEADEEGSRRRADFDLDGLTYAGLIDSETQWVESYRPFSNTTDRLVQSKDPASFTNLVAEGEDSFDFTTESTNGTVTRYIGSDQLTGETVEIDNVVLDRTEYEVRAFSETGELLWKSAGREFIQQDWRTFLGGVSTVSSGEEDSDIEVTEDSSPVDFIFPGEPGFLSLTPIHGCAVQSISFVPESGR